MPKQNRPFVRDGRLQTKKKRTDRSYLRPGSAPTAPAHPEPEASEPEEELEEAEPLAEAPAEAGAEAQAPAPSAPVPAPARPAAVATPPARPAPTRAPATARALQQQGIRKRREFDVHALAIRDTQYAIHELRRIAVLAAGIVITLIILGVVLR